MAEGGGAVCALEAAQWSGSRSAQFVPRPITEGGPHSRSGSFCRGEKFRPLMAV